MMKKFIFSLGLGLFSILFLQAQYTTFNTHSQYINTAHIYGLSAFLRKQEPTQPYQSFYFFSNEDIQTIKRSAATPWGKKIVTDLMRKIKEREKYPMNVPDTEGGYIHDYFCPVHNLRFTFDWNSPHAHYCSACKKKWGNNKKFDWAWIAEAHGRNLGYLVANMYLYLVTDSAKYACNIKNMLLDYSARYPAYVEHNREGEKTDKLSGRMFSQSLDEAVWAIDAARAFTVALPEMTGKEATTITSGYLSICAEMLMNRPAGGNWQAWHNGAIAALGIALRNDSILNVAINKPGYGYRPLMEKNVYNDGWWKEGSVVYHFYPLRAILLTAEAAKRRGIDLYDERLLKMFTSPIQMMYADLTFPSHNDGWYGTSLTDELNLYELAAQRYRDPILTNILSLCYQKTGRCVPEALLNGRELSPSPSPLHLGSCIFRDLGVGMLRSKDKTIVIKYGPHGGGHGHPDKLSISIHDGSGEILPDFGTTAYSLPVNNQWYRNTVAHNTVTIDKKNQMKGCGKLMAFEANKTGGRIVVNADSVYPGVAMTRELALHGQRLSDHFLCQSDSLHTYDYMLMLPWPCKFENPTDTMLPEYKPIEHVSFVSGSNPLAITVDGMSLKIKVRTSVPFEVFTGSAPGIPSTKAELVGQHVYPLIIRVKGTTLNIDATWKFDNH